MISYYTKPQESTVTYSIVYDMYIGGCSQQRLSNVKQFDSIKEADEYRWASSYCSPSPNLEFRIVFNRLSNGGWDEERYVYHKDKSEELEKLSYAGRDYSKETLEKVDIILKKHDKWRNK